MQFVPNERVRIFSDIEFKHPVGNGYVYPGQTLLWGRRIGKGNRYSVVKVVDSLYRQNFPHSYFVHWHEIGGWASWIQVDGKDPAVRIVKVPNNCIEVIGESKVIKSKTKLFLDLHLEFSHKYTAIKDMGIDLDELEEILDTMDQKYTLTLNSESLTVHFELEGVDEIPVFTAHIATKLDYAEQRTGLHFKYAKVVE